MLQAQKGKKKSFVLQNTSDEATKLTKQVKIPEKQKNAEIIRNPKSCVSKEFRYCVTHVN